jgi:hypothetical protein
MQLKFSYYSVKRHMDLKRNNVYLSSNAILTLWTCR